MKSKYYKFKEEAILLRKSGKTYSEIKNILKENIPKSTLSTWFKKITLTKRQKNKIRNKINNNIYYAREKALSTNKNKRKQYLLSVRNRVKHFKNIVENQDIAKIIIAMLYLGEGAKKTKGSLMFGNSDPRIVVLFLRLLRFCYSIDENKFRCTLQCRDGQNIKKLEKFWSEITKIPLTQFYKARVDKRTVGKKLKNKDYKGVCRIDYFSADIFNELKEIIELII